MSTTPNSDTQDTQADAMATGSAAPGAPGAATPEAGGGEASTGRDPSLGAGHQAEPTAADRAAARAEARFADAPADGTEDTDAGAAAGEQAGEGGDAPGADSTPEGTAAADEAGDKAGEGGKEGGSDSATAEPSAPEDWPAARREAFDKLPAEARQQVLDTYQDMQGGFTQAMQHVAHLRDVGETMLAHRANADDVKGLIEARAKFSSDPKGVIAQLAQEAGVEVFFEAPGAEDDLTPPEDVRDDAAKYNKWLLDKVEQRQQRQAEAARKQEAERQRAQDFKQRVAQSFRKLAEDRPDFKDHKDAVIDTMLANDGVKTPEEAYRIHTWDNLMKVAEERQTELTRLQGEVKTLKTELERLKTGGIKPPAQGGQGDLGAEEEKNLTARERAERRAERRFAAGG